MDLQADLDAVFYAPGGDFTVQALLRRPGVQDVPFTAQLTEAQQDQLDHRFTSAARSLRYPVRVVGELQEGDTVVIGPDTYAVRGIPEPVADALEAHVQLTKPA